MSTIRLLSIVAATTLTATTVAATPALAQRCLGLPMSGKNYVGFEQRESWTGYRRQAPVYGGRYAHKFDAGNGVGVIASIAGGGGGMKGDTSAVNVSGMLSSMAQVTPNVSLCASAGFEATAVDYPGESGNDADGRGSIPVSLGLGYDLHLGSLTVTPFAAPTLAYYGFEADGFKNGARKTGFDQYVTMGATASVNRFSLGTSYRHGDRSLGESGRFAFTTGVNV